MSEHFDVLIVGAGLSGIGAAWHLRDKCPGKTFAILEGRDAIGGTWDLFRYPGIRSDSDMYTLGYNFKPWTEPKIIADGASIRRYVQETATETGIDKQIRFGHKVVSAAWSSETATWTVQVQDKATGQTKSMVCNFLMMCSGYYNYEQGFTPEFKGKEAFKGQFIHPQQWPKDLNYTGKRVVVIGSGATAVTIVPSMADKAQHVTMLQRTPSYVVTVPQRDKMAEFMRKFMPEMWVYRFGRTRNILLTSAMFRLSRRFPNATRKMLQKQVAMQLGPQFDMKHFTPPYNPWDQRLCAVPNGDMFRILKQGKASIVTDHIDHITENGIKLKSGKELLADIIISATGLNLQLFGGMQVTVDGKALEMKDTVSYKGLMFSNIPNLSNTMGYTNASWTLKADLIAEYVCRLLKHMDETGTRICAPLLKDASEIGLSPFMDMTSGYFQRSIHSLPQTGTKAPWNLFQNYALDMNLLRNGTLEDGAMTFTKPSKVERTVPTQAQKRYAS
jgi:monooxygenase